MTESVAGFIAALYGDDQDPAFMATNPCVLSIADLQSAFCTAVAYGHADASIALFHEIERLTGAKPDPIAAGFAIGASAGIWRVQ